VQRGPYQAFCCERGRLASENAGSPGQAMRADRHFGATGLRLLEGIGTCRVMAVARVNISEAGHCRGGGKFPGSMPLGRRGRWIIRVHDVLLRA
jgi:hypothetical protein